MISSNSRIYRRLCKLLYPVSSLFHRSQVADPPLTSATVRLDNDGVTQDWKEFQLELVSRSFNDSGMILKCLNESVWYQNQNGPMLYRNVAGDGVVTVTVKTRKSSDPSSYPDSQWQFGGIMFRDPCSDAWMSAESYVFNVVGYRHDSLQIETKSTRFGYSDVIPYDWETGDAELQIQRQGPLFTLKARPVGSSQWQDMGQFNRPDFPDVMQLAIIAYAYSEGQGIVDLQAEFSDLRFTQ